MNEKCKCGITAIIKLDDNYWCRRCYDRHTEKLLLIDGLESEIERMPASILRMLLADILVYLLTEED